MHIFEFWKTMSDLNLYNTLSRQKEVFVPEDEKNVRMNVCGSRLHRLKSGLYFSDQLCNSKMEGWPV